MDLCISLDVYTALSLVVYANECRIVCYSYSQYTWSAVPISRSKPLNSKMLKSYLDIAGNNAAEHNKVTGGVVTVT